MFALNYNPFYNLNDFISIINKDDFKLCYKRKNNKIGYYVYNIPCAFDIETSSFYNEKNEKQVIMYVWQFGINGNVLIGRTWNEFITLLKKLNEKLELSENKILYCYVHNLSYEFQFIKDWLNWSNVFAVENRKPIKALCDFNIQFNDSYILSGYSLEKVGEHLQKYKVKKLVGFLDYEKIRTSETELTQDEINYCVNDVLVVMAYIQEYIENEQNKITNIPLTQTGVVRRLCKKNCFYGFSSDENLIKQNYYDYKQIMNNLKINDIQEYYCLKRAFQGGFSHGNALYINKLIENVSSYDFTSSYPYVMLSEKYPMGKGYKVEIKSINQYNDLRQNNLLIFDVEFIDIIQKTGVYENPISISRCFKAENYIVNNGRVVSADILQTTLTCIDFEYILKFYDIGHIKIGNCYAYAMGYLPKNYILSILELYNNKTKLKGVENKEREYLHNKEMLNSTYGMCVTDIIQEINTFDNVKQWYKEETDNIKEIEKYNNSKNRFLFYPWGVFVSAYARKNLFSGIYECGKDFIYSDTDSIKIKNKDKHLNYFETYNKNVENKLKLMCDFYNIDFNLCIPKTIKGIKKLIGVWDYEETYKYFKMLGSKRYLTYTEESGLNSTVAGTSKNGLVEYMTKKYNGNIKKIFNNFSNNLIIPKDYTHKLTHTYIDNEMKGIVKDYKNNYFEYYEKSGVHLEKTEYNLALSQIFIDYLKGVQRIE